MPLMEWNDKFSVGIEVFDSDHKTLVRMLNDLHDAVVAARSEAVLGKILRGLVAYTKTHFAREEQYMEKHGYPGLAEHRKQHVALTQQVLAVQQKYESGETTVLGMEVMGFLKDWLVKHIQGTDSGYSEFLRARGVH